MKITFILSQSMDSPDGVGRIGPLAKELSRLGHEVTILALHPDYRKLESKTQKFEGGDLYYVSQMHVLKRANEKTHFTGIKLYSIALIATIRLFLIAWKIPADLLYICKPHPMNSLAGLCIGWLRRKPVWVDCDDYESASGRFSSRWQRLVISWFERKVPGYANKITVNTHFLHQKYLTWGIPSSRIIPLPNGVDRQRFSPPDPDAVSRLAKKLQLGNEQVIVYIGSLSMPSHPVDVLMQAFRIILHVNQSVKLVIVGGGEEYQHLITLAHEMGISDHVIFCGRVPAHEVVNYYALGHVSVDPVRDDDAARGRAPLKLFESWACGIPFVTGDVGDRNILLGDPPAGILTAPGDPNSLAEGILRVLSDPSLSAMLVTRGRQRVEQYYWNVLAAEFQKRHLLQFQRA